MKKKTEQFIKPKIILLFYKYGKKIMIIKKMVQLKRVNKKVLEQNIKTTNCFIIM